MIYYKKNEDRKLMKLISINQIEEARARIQPYVRPTETSESLELSTRLRAKICLKWENCQVTGSFKIRGASNKILANLNDCRKKGVVTASTGNHGRAVAQVCRQEKLALSIYVPASLSEIKRKKLEDNKVNLVVVNGPCQQAESLARKEAALAGQMYVSPYNDEQVIAGQGTCGLEILRDWPEVEEIIVPVGGGGLIAGIAVYIKEKRPQVRITGVEPKNSAFIKHSLSVGRISNDFIEKLTIAEAVAGGLEENTVTFSLIERYVDDLLTVDEESILQAIKVIHSYHQQKAEGAGALSLAAVLSYPRLFSGKKILAVVSGGNIDVHHWSKIVSS
ncbi:MAG: pyridoxal-phosphate dependent enzyme [Acidobacteriota bacterium]|nr:pyridoxal-phosphate dependent enzyme [Acidobacteriota bacterium]MDW3228701.1 pyridoxal-phosphate dependent enzyme [Acidobacteriota bacterium]MDY0231397.1 pyridoxal-phosphate dependent enzyme [Candidatus Saccharicenans sp.]